MPELQEPLYVLKQKKSRAIIPRILSLIVLSVIFYLGILLNISLLRLTAIEETYLKTGTLIFLILIIIIGLFLAFRRAATPYLFYKEEIKFGKGFLNYQQITSTAPRQNLVDKIFKTYSLNLDGKFEISHIPKEVDIKGYIEQMIAYSRGQNPQIK